MENKKRKTEEKKEVAIVVLGDIGRSPRMCNHAKMLADKNFHVKMIGFNDSIPNDLILHHPNIEIIGIAAPAEMKRFPAVIQLALKLIWNFLTLLFALLFYTSFTNLRFILIQNPPALPTIPVCYLISKLKNSRFIIDWHNYMFSILKDKYDLTDDELFGSQNLKTSNKAKIVRIVSKLEGFFGKLSDGNLCVTNAMKNDLKNKWNIEANTFYDRPPTWKFKLPSLEQIHELFKKLEKTDEGKILKISNDPNETIITINNNGKIEKRADRPIVLLSSTSWTPDEKFDILFKSLLKYEQIAESKDDLPDILMIITGKGPLKEEYLNDINNKRLKKVKILTPWLEANDYPIMLFSADIGISLHISTSGLDLPMKVVDMFGAKIPVLAKNFQCIHELVKNNENGRLFDNENELFEQIYEIAKGFPESLNVLKKNVEKNKFESWEVMWNQNACPIIIPPNLASEDLLSREKSKTCLIYAIIIGISSIFIMFSIGFF